MGPPLKLICCELSEIRACKGQYSTRMKSIRLCEGKPNKKNYNLFYEKISEAVYGLELYLFLLQILGMLKEHKYPFEYYYFYM